MEKQGLNNPVAASVLSNPDNTKLILKTVLTLLSIGVVAGTGYIVYRKFFAFDEIKEDKRYAPANVNETQAKARAEAIYSAMLGFGANLQRVEANLAGLNHNAFIKVYNAFGVRTGADNPFKQMNLIEWLQDQFNASDLIKLRFHVKGFF